MNSNKQQLFVEVKRWEKKKKEWVEERERRSKNRENMEMKYFCEINTKAKCVMSFFVRNRAFDVDVAKFWPQRWLSSRNVEKFEKLTKLYNVTTLCLKILKLFRWNSNEEKAQEKLKTRTILYDHTIWSYFLIIHVSIFTPNKLN